MKGKSKMYGKGLGKKKACDVETTPLLRKAGQVDGWFPKGVKEKKSSEVWDGKTSTIWK